MTESTSHATVDGAQEELAGNPFMADVSGLLEELTAMVPERTVLSLDDLLQTDALDAVEPDVYGSHKPFLAGMIILEEAKTVQGAVEMLFDGCGPDTAAKIDGMFTGLKNNIAELSDSFPDGASLATLDDVRLLEKLAFQQEMFMDIARSREPELELARQQFVERMHYAIDVQGLPITREQLDERLASVTLGYRDPLNAREGSVATYNAVEGEVSININRYGEDLVADVFHELLHAISGVALDGDTLRHIGLELPDKKRLWLNEAITDLLADILLHPEGGGWDFGSQDMSLLEHGTKGWINAYLVMAHAHGRTYVSEKLAALDATTGIPSSVLLGAYFAQNNDPLESSRFAGSRAERELQRAIKSKGGVGAVRQLRTIDSLFTKSYGVILEQDSYVRQASKVAGSMASAKTTNEAQQLHLAQALRQTMYQERLVAARESIASQG